MMNNKYFCNLKKIGITAILAAAAATAIIFAGCANGNSGGRNPEEIRVEISAQNLLLVDDGQNTVEITVRVPALSAITGLGSRDTITVPIAIGGDAAPRVQISEDGGEFTTPTEGNYPITIAAGTMSKTIALRVHSDGASNTVNDSFTVQIGTPMSAGKLAVKSNYAIKVTGALGTTLPTNKQLTVTVFDSDRPSVSARLNPASLVEGTMGRLELTLNNPPDGDVPVTATVGNNVPLTLDGAKTTTETLKSGATTLSILIASIENDIDEADTTYPITISTTTAIEIANPMLTLTVIDDDPTTPYLTLASTESRVNEGAHAVFIINATNSTYQDVMIGYTIDVTGGATTEDYTDANNGMVTMPAGNTTAMISIGIVDDTVPNETGEGLTLTLGGITPLGAAINSTDDNAAITIEDNDGVEDDTIVIGFEMTRYVILENGGQQEVRIELKSGTLEEDAAIPVNFSTIDGRAKAPEDYIATMSTLSVSSPTNMDAEVIPINLDRIAEGKESFEVALSLPEGSLWTDRVTFDPMTATVDIVDEIILTIGFVNAPYEVSEEAGRVSAKVGLLSEGVFLGDGIILALDYEISDGTALAGDDYQNVPGTLFFDAKNTSNDIFIPITDDSLPEETESFTVTLTNVQASIEGIPFLGNNRPAVQLNPRTATVTITDTDTTPTD